MTDRREQIGAARRAAARRQRSIEFNAKMGVPLLAMALLFLFAQALSAIVPAFIPAHPGVFACWGVLLIAYWTIRMAGTS